ncbi:hypothetical protein [Tenacibaculum sp. IB213877]|uniref:hypothetical protein n=1 Tax=Tenacibaculum sp. IB213877 TaxID=3097351 RepID=UPI002A59A8F7|nr:hypothetical protein [Tenacibaculum sp. IB213877]MDY0779764.1 hypothetical protein [Tenacibaculum sp. IB213877]
MKNFTTVNKHDDSLFILIKSLTKSEKRQFNLYVSRLDGNTDAKFFALFKFLDKQKYYNEKDILDKGIVSKQQLSNLKSHLYKQILTSLRLNPQHKNIRIQIREQLDFATILYQKGLYKQSLKILEKTKKVALDYEEKYLAQEIIELEKVIENQYITRSISSRADELTLQAKEVSQLNVITSKLSNLSLQLYSLLLKRGYVKSDEELEEINSYFEARMPDYEFEKLGFREKLWLYKAHLWRSFLTQDFLQSYKYSNKWVDLFQDDPKNIQTHPVFYLKGKNYFLESLFFLKHYAKFKSELDCFEKEIANNEIVMNSNTEMLSFLYLYSNKLHLHFLEGTFAEGEYLVDIINKKINEYEDRLDNHHIVILYYKIGCLYFGAGNYKKTIEYLSKIINSKNLKVGDDLQCFARILSLIAHYEYGLDYDLERQFKDTYKFLLQMKNLQAVQKIFIESIRNLSDLYPHEFKKEFKRVYNVLQPYEHHPYEKRAFLYLDILSWLESKIENKPVAFIIKSKLP